jgi:hypothetical protein
MGSWFARQYNDIRGNFKWAVLLGLWWAISHYGKKMLELVPNISPWMVWTIIVVVTTAAFVWIAKVESRKPVVTAIQQTSAQPSAIVPGIPTLSALLGQNPKIEFDAKKFFALAYYSPITAEVEKNIKIIAQQNSPNDKEAFYARFIGVGVVTYQHDMTWAAIFGSQLAAMAVLNSRGLIPSADLKKHYDKAVVDYPKTYSNYSFDQWLDFMRNRLLIAIYPTKMVELSFNGKDFLRYVAHTGRDVRLKLN